MIKRLKNAIKNAPDKKVYIEVITAMLTVPVMVTVLLTNYNNLTKKEDKTKEAQEPTPKQEIIIKEIPVENKANAVEAVEKSPTKEACKKEIGPITISYPKEGQTVEDNPLNVVVKYDDTQYCSVVWSYRINGGPWSEYSSNSISFFDMQPGDKKLELRVQSTVSNDQEVIERNFVYSRKTDPTASSSAN